MNVLECVFVKNMRDWRVVKNIIIIGITEKEKRGLAHIKQSRQTTASVLFN